MKYVKQFAIIGLMIFFGECLNLLLPLPIPASIYGMLLLFICLLTGIIKLQQIEETADFLLGAMSVFFISPAVNIMNSVSILKESLIGVLLTCIVSTIVVMVVTGWVTQAVIVRGKKEGEADE